MRQIKLTTALLLIAALSFLSFGFKGCSQSEKDRNVAFARDIAGSVRAACPIVARKNPALSARCEQAANSADSLITAVSASDQTNIAALVREILPVFTDIAREFTNDDTVLTALALGQIGLNFFVNHFIQPAAAAGPKAGKARTSAAAAGSDVTIVDSYLELPQFGCRLKPERCN